MQKEVSMLQKPNKQLTTKPDPSWKVRQGFPKMLDFRWNLKRVDTIRGKVRGMEKETVWVKKNEHLQSQRWEGAWCAWAKEGRFWRGS